MLLVARDGRTHRSAVWKRPGRWGRPELVRPIRTMDASDYTPGTGESASDGGREPDLWVCRYCGNVFLRSERPTRCYHCRSGEPEELPAEDRERLARRLEEDEREKLLFG